MVDHSLYAQSVVDHAVWLARASGRSIDVVHVVDPLDPAAVHAGMAGLAVGGPGIVRDIHHSDEKLEQLKADAQLLVDRMTTRIAAGFGGVVLGRVIVGGLRHAVAELQSDADIIVLGKRGATADFVGLTLGSTLRTVVGVAQVPLLIAQRVFRDIAGWVVAVGDDFGISRPLASLLSTSILPTMPCEVVHVGECDELLKNHLEVVNRQLLDHGHASTIAMLEGQPVRVLAEQLASEETRLLAIGRFGRARLLPQLFGDTVANDLTRASLGPVLVLAP